MARADLLCDVIKYGLNNDSVNFRKAAEAICAEERTKQHGVLANRIEEMLKASNRMPNFSSPTVLSKNGSNGDATLFFGKDTRTKIARPNVTETRHSKLSRAYCRAYES